jgi:hypothetical protein
MTYGQGILVHNSILWAEALWQERLTRRDLSDVASPWAVASSLLAEIVGLSTRQAAARDWPGAAGAGTD